MIRSWHRLVRALRQSRIRLPQRSLTPEELLPGDWIQLESEVWRVKSRRVEAGRHAIDIETADGRAQAALLAKSKNRWTFQQGTLRLELPEHALIVFQGRLKSHFE